MEIRHLTATQVQEALDTANESFSGNLKFGYTPEQTGVKVIKVRCTLRVKDSGGDGARMSASGRRTVAATYDAHYAFMEAIMMINPEARISTAMEDYRGIGEFYAKAPSVAGITVQHCGVRTSFGEL